MMHRAWSSIVEVPYCFSRSCVNFQGFTALKIVEFDPNWAFPDRNSSLNALMAMKCCTKLETAKERCSIVFQGHPSNFKVTRYKTSPILTQIGRFRTICRSQLSIPQICLVPYPSGLLHWHWSKHVIAPVLVKQPSMWINVLHECTRNWWYSDSKEKYTQTMCIFCGMHYLLWQLSIAGGAWLCEYLLCSDCQLSQVNWLQGISAISWLVMEPQIGDM